MKKKLFWIITILITLGFIELISMIGYFAINRSFFSFSEIGEKLNINITSQSIGTSIKGTSDLKWGDFVEMLHPYFGFVADPYRNKQNWGVSDFGFILSENVNPILKKSNNKIVIGFFGGSFTNGVYLSMKSLLNNKYNSFNKEFILLNFACGGYKQPQQLMILNYLLALGAEFDIVINIDGFNEVVLPIAENIPNNVNPFYPRMWHVRTANTIDLENIKKLGYMELLKDKRRSWVQLFQKYRFYLSPTLYLIWQFRDRMLSNSIYEINQNIEIKGNGSKDYSMHGPKYTYESERKVYHDIVEIWKRCSLQMKNLCDANNIRYYHFLQPNQYVDGSKPMTEEEKKQALTKGHPYEIGVVNGYPLLRKTGRELQALGVRFTDFTMIFSDNRDILYIDDCCHVSEKGYDIAAKRIYDIIYKNFYK